MEQAERDALLQSADQYGAEALLDKAVKLLYKNKKIKIDIQEAEWHVNEIKGDLVLSVNFIADGHYSIINILETIFRDYQRQYDATIGIKPDMDIKTKIVLRLAYLLYTHRSN